MKNLNKIIIIVSFILLVGISNGMAISDPIIKPNITRDIVDDYAKFEVGEKEIISEHIAGVKYKYAKTDDIIIYTKKRSDGYCSYDFSKGIRHCDVPVEIINKDINKIFA